MGRHCVLVDDKNPSSVLSSSVIIRRAEASDVPVLCQLGEALARQHQGYDRQRYQFTEDVTGAYADLLAKHLHDSDAVILVAERDDQVVGYVLCVVEAPSLVMLTGRVGWIHDLYLLPAARGCGAGGKLLDKAISELQLKGCPGGILLGVAPQNEAAATLFQRRGFRPTLQEMTLSL